MVQVIRRSLEFASVCGLLASILIYIASYLGATMESIAYAAIVLHGGIFVTLLATSVVQYKDHPFWRSNRIKPPKPVARAMTVLALFFAFHFFLFLVQSHGAAPAIRDGEYVLNNHGHIIGVITQAEFVKLKAAELRLFATGWIFFYFAPTA